MPKTASEAITAVIRRVGGLEVKKYPDLNRKSVIRRVGGLEDDFITGSENDAVIRRVGGLEAYFMRELGALPVIRRVGGLEAYLPARADRLGVIRRVGGLDCQKLRPHSAAGAFVLEHVQGEVDADSRLSSPYGIPPSSHIGR